MEDLAPGPFGDKCARCIGRHPARGRSGARGTRRLVTLWEVAANGAGAFAASDAAGLVGPHGELDAVSGAELAHEAGQVGFDGARGDVELAGDLIVGAALGYRHEDFLLAGGSTYTEDASGGFHHLFVHSGNAKTLDADLKQGQSYIIPAAAGRYEIQADEPVVIFKTYLPA